MNEYLIEFMNGTIEQKAWAKSTANMEYSTSLQQMQNGPHMLAMMLEVIQLQCQCLSCQRTWQEMQPQQPLLIETYHLD